MADSFLNVISLFDVKILMMTSQYS